MLRTLFLIPHEIAGIPVLGVGWVLAAFVAITLLRLCLAWRSGGSQRLTAMAGAEGVFWVVAAVIIVVLGPRLELNNVSGEPVGMAVRGYGAFLMLAAASAVGLAALRADRIGKRPDRKKDGLVISGDLIYGLAPWVMVGGLAGARLFYVIQYNEQFMRPTWGATLAAMANLTQGGLVVYGGFIGGFVAAVLACRRHHWPIGLIGDAIAPCLFVGLFFGRLGCLMNGCCWGGACEPDTFAAHFPPGSPVYQEQMLSGRLVGLQGTPMSDVDKHASKRELEVTNVAADSVAAEQGVKPGDTITLSLDGVAQTLAPETRPAEESLPGLAMYRDGRLLGRFWQSELPERALAVRATQVISSLFAACAFAWILACEWLLSRQQKRVPPGVLMLVAFATYAVLRLVLEWIRVDEAGQFGTGLSISQWVSLGVLFASVGCLIARLRMQVDDDQSQPPRDVTQADAA